MTSIMTAPELHSNAKPVMMAEEIEAKRLLDEDVIHFDVVAANGASPCLNFGAKSI